MATTTASTLTAIRRRGINKAQASQSGLQDIEQAKAEATTAAVQEAPGGTTPYKGSAQEKAAQEQQTGPSPTTVQPGTDYGAPDKSQAGPVPETTPTQAPETGSGPGGRRTFYDWLKDLGKDSGSGTPTDPNSPTTGSGAVGASGAPTGQGAAGSVGQLGPGGTPAESGPLLDRTVAAADDVASTGKRDVERGQTAADKATEDAKAESDEMKLGQGENVDALDTASANATAGDLDNQALIETTRDRIATLPEDVQTAFDDNKGDMDDAIDAGRAGIDTRESDALGKVMDGRAGAMDAAVASIHGALRNQMSQIDAQVQQGTLSPSQATAMKAKIRMGGSMQLSAAIGQTTLAFNKLEADVATSFGNMFTTFETNATNAEAQFGAAAAGAVGQANIAKGELNNALTAMSAQSRATRDATISNNLATRSTFVNNNDAHNMAMLDHTDDEVILAQPSAINSYTSYADTFSTLTKTEHGQAMLELMKDNADLTAMFGGFNIAFELAKGLAGG